MREARSSTSCPSPGHVRAQSSIGQLAHYFRGRKFFGAKDRRAVSDAANANDLSIVLNFVSDPAQVARVECRLGLRRDYRREYRQDRREADGRWVIERLEP